MNRRLALVLFWTASLLARESLVNGQEAATPPAPPQSPSAPAPADAAPSAKVNVEEMAQRSLARLQNLFRPFQTERAALSPDGRRLAYTLREDATLSIVVVEIDHPEKALAKVAVATDATSTPMMQVEARERRPAQVRWMGWATPNRLVVETNTVFPEATADGDWLSPAGAILAFDADGSNAVTIATPLTLSRQTINEPAPTSTDTQFRTPADPFEDTADSAETLDPDDDAAAPAEPTIPEIVRDPRSPHFFDFAPGEPDAILLRAGTERAFDLYRANTVTGKVKHLTDAVVEPGLMAMVDRQGNPRIGVPDSLRSRFPHRYLLEVRRFGLGRWKPLDDVAGFALDGPGFSVSPDNFFGERAEPVGFDEDPDILYFASNIGRDTFGIYSLDLKTGLRDGLVVENPYFDLFQSSPGEMARPGTLVFDRFTRKLIGIRFQGRQNTAVWLRPEWRDAQAVLESSFRGQNIEILEWDEKAERFLALIHGPVDTGAFHVFDRTRAQAMEFARRAPWGEASTTAWGLDFAFDAPSGVPIDGTVIVPREARVRPIPMLVVCPPTPWARVRPDYQPEMLAFAAMGLVVVQVNCRGAWGFGTKRREAVKDGYEEAQIADLLAAIDHLAQRFQVNPQRVALYGEHFGGFVALRALQLHPDRFRCAIALEPPINLAGWVESMRWTEGSPAAALVRGILGDRERLQAAPLASQPELVTRPVFLLAYRGPPGQMPRPTFAQARAFFSAVQSRGGSGEFLEVGADYHQGMPQARSRAFRRIEQFLNVALYDYKVSAGDLEVLPE